MRTHVKTLAALPAALLLLAAGEALAQAQGLDSKTEQVVQESFVGDMAQTQQQQSLQVTVGADVRPADAEAALRTPLLLQYGITDRLQLGADVELGFFTGQGVQLGQVEPEAAYAFVDSEEAGLSLVGGLRASLPLGGLSQDEPFALVPNVGLYKRLSPVALSVRLGAQVPVAAGRAAASAGSVSPEGSATLLWAQEGVLHPLVEVRAEGGDQPETRLAAGGMVDLGESWQLGVAYALTRQQAQNVQGAFATLTWQSQ
jgi:hypothetical protein